MRPPPDNASSPCIRLCYRRVSGPSDSQTEYFVMRGIFWSGTLPCLPAGAISWHFIVVLAISCSSSHACRQYLQA